MTHMADLPNIFCKLEVFISYFNHSNLLREINLVVHCSPQTKEYGNMDTETCSNPRT